MAIPRESLQRDPSRFHKSAYARLLARAFQAEFLWLRSEEELVPEIARRKPELLITMNLPWYDRYSDRPLMHLPRDLPLVTIHDDCRRQMHPRLEQVLDRADVIISPVYQPVLHPTQFPHVAHKLYCLPYFIPSEVPSYRLHPRPIARCLVTGAVDSLYPLRSRAIQNLPPNLIERLVHPGYWQRQYDSALLGQRYFDMLHHYLCGLTCGSIYRCAVAKYFEIPYTGSLLLADVVPDLDGLGFQAGKHFIAIHEQTDLVELIAQIVASPDIYQSIRREGQALVIARHTERAREPKACELAERVRDYLGIGSRSHPVVAERCPPV